MRKKIALIVGRFQPFHKGHLFLIKKALKIADEIVVGIGSANITDVNNPIDFETRKKVIKAVAYKEKFENKLIKIVPLDDFLDDKKWLTNLKKQVGEFDITLGNNDWTNNILGKAGYKVMNVDYYKRGMYEGWRIRKLIKEGKKWQDRVPNYIVKWLYGYMVENNNLIIQQFNHVVLGGTFDHFHAGHEALLKKAFEIGKKVTIGIATEEIYKDKLLSETVEPFSARKKSVEKFIKKYLVDGRTIDIISFSEFTGGADKQKEIDAIVVSKETFPNALKINELRAKNKLKPLMIVIIEDVLAEDGKLISSERIRAGEINREGHNFQFSIFNFQKQDIKMPEELRLTLQKPLGQVFKDEKSLLRCIDTSKYIMIIAVGDIIVDSLLKTGIDPDVKIIDFRSRRQEFSISNFQFSIKSQILNSKKYQNKPGTMNLKTAEIIHKKIKLALYKKEKSWLLVDGEEDLLALPAILFAPLNSLVLYGHWQYGIIVVEVLEEKKKQVVEFLKSFK